MSRNYLPLDTCLFYSQIINRAVHVVSSRLSQGQALGLPVLRCKPGCGDSYYQIDRSIQPNSCELQVGYNILCLLLGLFLPELFCAYSPVSKKPVWAWFPSRATSLKCWLAWGLSRINFWSGSPGCNPHNASVFSHLPWVIHSPQGWQLCSRCWSLLCETSPL